MRDYFISTFIMASLGQRRGSCGHVMAGFDLHKKCAHCREKKVGDDPCVKGQDCEICDSFSDIQRGMLATPQYQIRKDKKAGVLVSSSKVTVVGQVGEHEIAISACARSGLLPVHPRFF